ncbi:S8 family peptidase [Deinococcus maricopensis]|uniref:Aqualysin 1 n=1 Tax=Deinococcus maricopensis (strain DSM 21211 / LMG 22137 / NRRL B-23946 / LB-34) TaxID=709986 RepID=E8UA66_DEIML|nr:S8 family peptidase [Deinococcus maricopensis]ADV67955.1 Aqualysin 1 [Deinococcus maricopensis DSM 21211]
MHKQLTMTGILGLTLLLAGCGNMTAQTPSSTTAPTAGTAIPGQYIVVLNKRAISTANMNAQSVSGLVTQLGLDAAGVNVLQVYSTALNGFAAKLSDANLAKLKSNPAVSYVEQDATVRADATQTGATWGLDRIDQRNLPLDSSYTYSTTASNVTAYIIDTGIRTTHNEFGGRASWGTNTSGDGQNTDCNGHGTHVAGTVGGSTYGVAKGVKLVAIKVLNCQGSGSNSGVIAGIDWAAKNRSGAGVANMSLGGGASSAVDTAILNATNSGLTMVVAAGNENQDACNVSPARAPSAITVGATTNTDARSSFSNYGSCVDIFAPGSNITSSWNTSDTATNTISGTSMATPHVVGGAALYLAANPTATPAQVASALKGNATPNKVTNAGTGSPNLLLYTGSGTTPPPPTGGTTTYTGTLSGRGVSSFQPGMNGFTYAGGTLKATLTGPSNTDFDLYLQKLNGTTWTDVAASEGSSSSEGITYNAANGTYRWEVYSYSGSGNFQLVEQK